MENEKEEIDRSKLKSFMDLPMLSNRNMYSGRRHTAKFPIKRLIYKPENEEKEIKPSYTPRRILMPRTYKITRSSTMKLKGYRHDFQIYYREEPLYHAKVKPYAKMNQIGISEGTESHISAAKFEAVLLYSESFTDFSLRQTNAFGNELLRFSFNKIDQLKPRTLKVSFVRHPPSVPNEMNTIEPEANDDLKWEVDLNSDNVIASIKNCRLEDQDSRNYLIVRKVEDNCLEVETTLNITALYVFAIAIGSFLYK